jgi:hypothetical protein
VALPGHKRRCVRVVAAASAQAPVLPTWLSPAAEKYRFTTNKRVSVSSSSATITRRPQSSC